MVEAYCDGEAMCTEMLSRKISVQELAEVFGIEENSCDMFTVSGQTVEECLNEVNLQDCLNTKIDKSKRVKCNQFVYDFSGTGSRNDRYKNLFLNKALGFIKVINFSLMTSITAELDLVCDSAWKIPFSISMQSVAVFIGSAFGALSDKLGRRPAMIIAALGQVLYINCIKSMTKVKKKLTFIR